MTSTSLEKYRDEGLLLIRAGMGFAFIWFLGLPKFTGGAPVLIDTGAAMAHLGITGGHYWWGVAAALTETVGALMLALGLLFRPVTAVLTFMMIVATIEQFSRPMPAAVHSINNAFVFAGLFLIGPGRLSLDYVLRRR